MAFARSDRVEVARRYSGWLPGQIRNPLKSKERCLPVRNQGGGTPVKRTPIPSETR